MRHEGVDDARGRHLGLLARGEGLPQSPLDEAVLLIREGRFGILAQGLGDPPRLAVADLRPDRIAFARVQVAFDLCVAFEHLQGVVARREGLGKLPAVGAHVAVQASQPLLDHRAHVDMDVAHAFVAVLVDVDHRVEQRLDAPVVARLDGHHRHTHHAAEAVVVEARAAGLQFVVHVQRDDHAGVDVDQFGGQVEVALEVRGHHGVDDHVGHLRGEVLAHETLFGRIGRQGIGSGQVGDLEAVAAVEAVSHLGADGHAAVVAHMLVASRNGVEQRGFAAVGIPDQGHADRAAAVRDHVGDAFAFRHVGGVRHGGDGCGVLRGRSGFGPGAAGLQAVGEDLVGLAVGKHLDHVGLAAAQRDLVAHDPVFDRILERGVQDHLDPLSADEAHLHDAASEASVAHDLDDGRHVAGIQFG